MSLSHSDRKTITFHFLNFKNTESLNNEGLGNLRFC